MVKIAWSYAVVKGDVQALRLVSLLPVSYLDEELPEDASTDTELLAASDGLAAWLVERGHVDMTAANDPMAHVLTVARA